MASITIENILHVLKQAGTGFIRDKVPKLSASLAYYTIFSLGPMLMVVIFLSNLFWRKEAIEGILYAQIKDIVGSKAALQIQEIIRNASLDDNSILGVLISMGILLVGATTVFTDIQDSINTIWKLKIKTDKGWLIILQHRLLSFSLVVSLAFILLVSLIINGLVESLMNSLREIFPHATVFIVYIVNLIITLLVTSTLFAIIFKVLPDAVIRWKDVIVGAIFTAFLFMIGRYGLTLYISSSDLGSAHGAAGSLVILVLWVYFSAIILYFGAEFTKFYALKFGCEIKPKEYAVVVHTVQVESKKKNLQENEEDLENTEKHLQKAKQELDERSHKNLSEK